MRQGTREVGEKQNGWKCVQRMNTPPCDCIRARQWWYLLLILPLGRQKQADLCEFKTSLVYRVCSRTAKATQRNTVSKKKKKKGASWHCLMLLLSSQLFIYVQIAGPVSPIHSSQPWQRCHAVPISPWWTQVPSNKVSISD